MELKIRAGMRVLYKYNNSNWLVGELSAGHAILNEDGLYLPIYSAEDMEKLHQPKFAWESPEAILISIHDIFWDAFPIEDWMRIYSEVLMTKEEYLKFIEKEDFDKRIEKAYVSDGEYGYYPVSKYTQTWLEKQPFDYIVREA